MLKGERYEVPNAIRLTCLLVKATFTEVGKRRQTGVSPRGTAGCVRKGMGKRVHRHYPDPSIK